MCSITRVRVLVMVVFCVMILATVNPIGRASAQPAQLPSRKPRVVFTKPAKTILTSAVRPDSVILKFQEGTHIRLRAGRLVFDRNSISPDEQIRLVREHVGVDRVQRDLTIFDQLIQQPQYHLARLFARPEAQLDRDKQQGEQVSAEELADLNLYYTVQIANAHPDTTAQLIDQLNALAIVEIAYAEPLAKPADIAPATPDFSGSQGYLNAAPNGIDARYAWTVGGGRGNGVRVIDIEQGWQLDHEDLPSTFYTGGTQSTARDDIDHGTAVLGEIAALDDGHGVSGIAPAAGIGVVSYYSRKPADAINEAAGQLNRGDIILVEIHAPGPSSGLTCNDGNCSQWEYIAVEYWQAEYDAIHTATANGIVVVEAAGNGGMDLDSAIYDRRFDRTNRDSGAILVGAGTSTGRAPHAWTNFGSRVDVQGWGDSVMTLGYGDMTVAGAAADSRQWYTAGFSGTSSASPIVVGAVASIQGIRRVRMQPVFDPLSMRRLLQLTGTPQASNTHQIGPLPNLRAAITALADRYAEAGGACSIAGGPGTLNQPDCSLETALLATPSGGTVGIVRGSVYSSPRIISKPVTLVSVGGTATLGR